VFWGGIKIEDYIQNADTYVATELAPAAAVDAGTGLLPRPQGWAIAGGFTHPMPGSRLLQYGEHRLT
jgi:hypothetical protein